MEKYFINYGTGAGNEYSETIEKAKEVTEEGLSYTQKDVVVYDGIRSNTMCEDIVMLNEKLKKINNFSDLDNLEKEINSYGKGYIFRMKKTHFQAYAFTDNGNGKADYLISDGVSRRLCPYNKLSIYVEVSDSAR